MSIGAGLGWLEMDNAALRKKEVGEFPYLLPQWLTLNSCTLPVLAQAVNFPQSTFR